MKNAILFFLFFSQTLFSQSHKSLVCSSASSSAHGSYVVGKIFVVPEPLDKKPLPKPNKLPAIVIYPNPVTSELTIDSKEEIKSFSIYSAEGKFVTQGAVTNNSLTLSTLKKGYYTIIFDNDRSKAFKLLKN